MMERVSRYARALKLSRLYSDKLVATSEYNIFWDFDFFVFDDLW